MKRFENLWLIFKIIFFSLASWALVHLLAFFGFFISLSYPFWSFFAPRLVPCFICQTKKEGERCNFCRQPIDKSNVSPKSNFSILCNATLILFLSFISLGVIFIESRILFELGFPPTEKTVAFVIPSKNQYLLEETFPMKIEITGIKTPINTVQMDLSFDSQKIEVVDISTQDSFANIFIQKEINNQMGYVRLTGGLPNPGFTSDSGIFATVFFQGKTPGVVDVSFLPSSLVLANDGRGTNVLKEYATASYLILPERITDSEKEQQGALIHRENLVDQDVLGEKAQKTQLKFYEESEVKIEKQTKELEKKETSNLIEDSFNLVEKVDRFVLSFWEKVFKLDFL